MSATEHPPAELNGARVLLYAHLEPPLEDTEPAAHEVEGIDLSNVTSLAICMYEADEGFYLFYCGPGWQVLSDTFHETLHTAQDEAEVAFSGVSASWNAP
ncbi:MAG TPA: hypothetical protein VGR00_15125 [Thermoanaerobaculia bacterium]|nr:hypothetical protein [Thermoanaerobaculia bacterium]